MDTTTVALIAAGIGATGAVAGQIVAAIFTGRRESKKLTWEKQQAAERRQVERDRLFADTKREVYARFLELVNKHRRYLSRVPVRINNDARADLAATGDTFYDTSNEVLAEISLFSQDIHQRGLRVGMQMLTWEAGLRQGPARGDFDDRGIVDKLIGELQAAMRLDLGIALPSAELKRRGS